MYHIGTSVSVSGNVDCRLSFTLREWR